MTIDAAALQWATLENLERLARSLGVPILRGGSKEWRHQRLVEQVLDALEEQRKKEQ